MIMALIAQVGNTALVSGNNNTTLNFSVAPRIVILLGNRQISTGYTPDASITLGYGDGTLVGTNSAQEIDNQSVDCNSLVAGWGFAGQVHCNEQVQTGNHLWWQYNGLTFNPTSATMVIGSTPFPGASLINFLVLSSGTSNSITNLASQNFNINTALGIQQITTVGFKPDIVLFFWGSWIAGQGANTAMSFGCGAAVASGTGNQWAIGTAGQGPTNSTHKTTQRTDRCISIGNLTQVDTDASFVSMDALGFTITIQTAGGRASVPVGWIAMKGAQFKVGSFNKNTGLAPVSDHINLGFAPKAAFLASHGTVTSTALQNDSTLSFGIADGVNQANIWVGMKHGVATAGAHSRHLTNKTITIASGTTAGVTPTTIAEADISFSNTGMNVNWTTNDATPDEILYWVVGNAVGPAQAAVILQAVKRAKFW